MVYYTQFALAHTLHYIKHVMLHFIRLFHNKVMDLQAGYTMHFFYLLASLTAQRALPVYLRTSVQKNQKVSRAAYSSKIIVAVAG